VLKVALPFGVGALQAAQEGADGGVFRVGAAASHCQTSTVALATGAQPFATLTTVSASASGVPALPSVMSCGRRPY
jgi:hypothetical protein